MTEPLITSLSEQDAIEQIVDTIQRADPGKAPFALVLGAGFSHGLVPTARELVEGGLPQWMHAVANGTEFRANTETDQEKSAEIARAFWRLFVAKNEARGLELPLDPGTGLPVNYADGYSAAFHYKYTGALGEPADARKFHRALMEGNQLGLNAAHYLLALLLGSQPGKSRQSDLFKAKAAFSRLVLTTNFDPFLQTALQAVGRLYLMSDTPELGVGDDISDEQTDAIHLVYLHGSIHRRSQFAAINDIKRIKEQNARILEPVLKRHGVIVLGYSGWDDAIVEALNACDRFDHRLYWCGLEADPLAKKAFGPEVSGILRKSSAVYVQIKNAGSFMAQICRRLVDGVPFPLSNPIGYLRGMFGKINFSELTNPDPKTPIVSGVASTETMYVNALDHAKQRLFDAEKFYLDPTSPLPETHLVVPTLRPAKDAPTREDSRSISRKPASTREIQDLWSSVQAAARMENFREVFQLCSTALDLDLQAPSARAMFWQARGAANYVLRDFDNAIEDLTRIIGLNDAPVEEVATALGNRAIVWRLKGNPEKEIEDYSHLIDRLPGAPTPHLERALYNRGIAWGRKGNLDQANGDYTRLIERVPDAPVDLIANSFINRGSNWGKIGDIEKELADYSSVITELPRAPIDAKAEALFDRAVTWGEKGDVAKELADYTHLIDQLPGAPVTKVAGALINRSARSVENGDSNAALTDLTRVIEDLSGVPIDVVARALVNRGAVWFRQEEAHKAIADFTHVIEQTPNAPAEQIAMALVNRAMSWRQKGEDEKAIIDYSRMIEECAEPALDLLALSIVNHAVLWGSKGLMELEMAGYTRVADRLPGAPVDQVAKAIFNRSVRLIAKGETEKALEDYSRLIDQLPGVPTELLSSALFNRAVLKTREGDVATALLDYTRLVEQVEGAAIKEVGKGLINRSVIWMEKGDGEREQADLSRVIEQLPGVSTDLVAQALLNRSLTLQRKGDEIGQLADLTHIIELLPDAPSEAAQALIGRAGIWRKRGESEKELDDYSYIIEHIQNARDREKALALANRGWMAYKRGDFDVFLKDTEAALGLLPSESAAAYNLGLALLACGRDGEALDAYRKAVLEFPTVIEVLGLVDLEDAKKKWLSSERAQPAIDLLASAKASRE